FDLNLHEPCAQALSGNFKKTFLPMVYGIKFTIGIAGNGLVILVVGYQKTVLTTTDKYRLHLSIADLLFVLDAVDTCHSGGFLCMSDVQDVSSSSYLFMEDGVESVGSSAICQRSYPSKSGRRFFGCWLPYCLSIFVDTLTLLNIVVSSSCEVQRAPPSLSTMKGTVDGFFKLPAYSGSEEIVFSPDSSGSSDFLDPNHVSLRLPLYVLLILFVGSAVSEQVC
ncbi:hypothetical protein GOODEAATRI_030882, partial [Goodea atripinnis]